MTSLAKINLLRIKYAHLAYGRPTRVDTETVVGYEKYWLYNETDTKSQIRAFWDRIVDNTAQVINGHELKYKL